MALPKKKTEYTAAQDSRRLKPMEQPSFQSQIAALIYHLFFKVFFLGVFLAVAQLAYQVYYWATAKLWPSFSALFVLESHLGFTLEKYPTIKPYLDEISIGVFLAALSIAVIIIVQLFMSKTER